MKYLSVSDYAKKHGVSTERIRQFIYNKRLDHVKVADRYLIHSNTPYPAKTHGRPRKKLQFGCKI